MSETRERYDLAIVGGGVQGAALLLEATRRGLAAVLVEKGDFGAGTTSQSLRIVHGGLRDLKRLDVARCRAMAAAQAEWLRDFPDQVRPLDCVLPLDGPGKAWVARAGLALHALATRDLRDARRVPAGRIDEREDLGRCATWTEGLVVDPRRLVEAMIERARREGGVAHAQTEVIGFAGESRSLRVVDHSTGEEREIKAERVVVAAGPATDEVLRRLGVESAESVRPSLAWNLVLDRPPPLENAALVVPVDGGMRLLVPGPDHATTVVGTFHAPLAPDANPPSELPDSLVRASINELDRAHPALGIEHREIAGVLHGVLPVTRPGSTDLVRHSIVRRHDHGLASLVAVKLTTARNVARRFLDRWA